MLAEMKPRIGITIGDPAGIGPEIVLDTVRDPRVLAVCHPLVIGDPEVLDRCALMTGRPALRGADLEVVRVQGAYEPGRVGPSAGRAAYEAVRRACALGQAGRIDAIVTAPINKESLRAAGIPHIGHTEILADALLANDPLTMFVTERMRIFFLSRHLSLRRAIEAVERSRVHAFVCRVDEALQAIGVDRPRIGLAALNPHASDGGQFGDEERLHLQPAARLCREQGIDCSDPIGADSVFHLALDGHFDGVVSLYHDQGHIAAKTRDFFGTVTATLGLPILRTSVDHGTAFDIAWTGQASPVSLVKAVLCAVELLEGGLSREASGSPVG